MGDRAAALMISDSEFVGRIEGDAHVGETAAIVPSITGRAWTTGTHQVTVDPSDPWPQGYRIGDTCPVTE